MVLSFRILQTTFTYLERIIRNSPKNYGIFPLAVTLGCECGFALQILAVSKADGEFPPSQTTPDLRKTLLFKLSTKRAV